MFSPLVLSLLICFLIFILLISYDKQKLKQKVPTVLKATVFTNFVKIKSSAVVNVLFKDMSPLEKKCYRALTASLAGGTITYAGYKFVQRGDLPAKVEIIETINYYPDGSISSQQKTTTIQNNSSSFGHFFSLKKK